MSEANTFRKLETKREGVDIETDQNICRGSGDGRQHIDTLGWEVAPTLSACALSIAPTRVHDDLAVVLIQNDQVSLVETKEGGSITWVEADEVIMRYFKQTRNRKGRDSLGAL